MIPRSTPHPDYVKRAADWYATNQSKLIQDSPGAIARFMQRMFDLSDSETADAVLLAGNYSLCRRAFE